MDHSHMTRTHGGDKVRFQIQLFKFVSLEINIIIFLHLKLWFCEKNHSWSPVFDILLFSLLQLAGNQPHSSLSSIFAAKNYHQVGIISYHSWPEQPQKKQENHYIIKAVLLNWRTKRFSCNNIKSSKISFYASVIYESLSQLRRWCWTSSVIKS